MKTTASFPASDLQRNPAEIQKAALMGPVFLTYHDKPRYVMMSLDEFVRIQGKDIAAQIDSYPPPVADRIRDLTDSSQGVRPALKPGGPALDKLVLATVNAPYKRAIDARTLRDCLNKADLDRWLVHIATFFTDVTPDLVLGFSDQHGISRSSLAKAYRAMKQKTGEKNPKLEADLARMATSPPANRRRAGAPSRQRKRGS